MKSLNTYVIEGLADWSDDKLDKKISKQTTKAAIKKEIIDWIKDNVKTIKKTNLKFDFNTSPITVNYDGDVEFKFDIAILGKNSQGNLCRLIHNKWYGTYNWCEVPSSKNVRAKADKLKKLGMWNEVRDTYEELKNLYLRRGDRDHPSFVVYVEAVNQVYQTI